VYAAFLLFAVLLAVAALFMLVGAAFVALSQIMVYVGGILILIVFGVMLTDKDLLQQPRTEVINLGGGVLLAAGLGSVLVWMLLQPAWQAILHRAPHTALADESALSLGTLLLTDLLVPFELVSVLLLAALVGAAWVARIRGE
jgi:NADH-quinone oxidoreductase subunit J